MNTDWERKKFLARIQSVIGNVLTMHIMLSTVRTILPYNHTFLSDLHWAKHVSASHS